MRSIFTSITLYGLLLVSVISVLPMELLMDTSDEQIAFFEEESEGEKESEEKEKKEKEKREKSEQKNKKAKKFLASSRVFDTMLVERMSRIRNCLNAWDSPVLAVISPPPESMLG